MKVEATTDQPDGKGNVLYYTLLTDNGTCIGGAYCNVSPLPGDDVMTLEDAKKNATLWAAAPELLEALLACEVTLKAFLPDAFETISLTEQALKKAKGL